MNPIFNVKKHAKFNKDFCFICQKRKKSGGKIISLASANEQSIIKLKKAAEKRKNLGEIDAIFDRIDTYLQNDSTIEVKWHTVNCYGPFTQEDKIKRLALKNEKPNQSKIEETLNLQTKVKITRSKIPTFFWNLCAFCQINCKKIQHNMSEMRISDYVKNNSKLNLRLSIALSTVSDCPSADLKYHLNCYSRFVRLVNKSNKEERNIDYAMHYTIDELINAASKGDVILLDDVWDKYESYAIKYNTQLTGSYKDKHTFTRILKNKLQESFHFFHKLNDNEVIMFPINHLNGGIASIIHQNDKELEESIIPKYRPENESEFLALVHVALRLRGEILAKPGCNGLSVTEDDAVGCIPENLYLFLSLLFGGQELLESEEFEKLKKGKLTKNVVMSIAQDIIFGLSKGKKLTPKHIGLASTLHQKTRSKQLVNLFHKAGHCLSYDNLLKLDTTLANDTLTSLDEKTGAVIPKNIVPGSFIHYSADNIDIDTNTNDGKGMFHATQVTAYQRSDGSSTLPYSHIENFSKKSTLQVPRILTKIPTIRVKNEQSAPTMEYPISVDSFKNSEQDKSYIEAKAADNAFYLYRQAMPVRFGWTEYNQIDNKNCSSETTIGHMPIILSEAHDYDTINIVIQRCMAVSSHFEQSYTIITVDQQLFCKMHNLISNIPEYQLKVIPRLGGLHISLNFLKIIGKHMSGCGLYDAWIDSNILGEVAAQKVLAGKDYSKGMRVHKITLQALWRIITPEFMEFLNKKDPNMAKSMNDSINKYECEEESDIDLKILLKTEKWLHHLSQFTKEKSEKSANYTFWWNYMEMVSTLLMFTRAQRDGIWNLYISSFKKMIPFFFQYDHQNYARWGVIYAAQMMQIPNEIREEFVKGNFVVKCSKQNFTQVDPDHAQEWQNRKCKIAGGIIGITRTPSALMKWSLSLNARSFIADQTYKMFDMNMDNIVNKESMDSQKRIDNEDENNLYSTLISFKIFMDNSDTMMNIASKDLATMEIQTSLLEAEANGRICMEKFIEQMTKGSVIIDVNEFYRKLDRNNTKTFENLYMKTAISKNKEKMAVVKVNRNYLLRIIAAHEIGQKPNLPKIVSKEMLPVPLSLAKLNGSLNPGDKAILQKELLKDIVCPESIALNENPSCIIIDGQALIYSLGKCKNCSTFGEQADNFIESVLIQGRSFDRIDIVFDRYRVNSIKESTRIRRTQNQKPIRKSNIDRSVKLPPNWPGFMASPENKSEYSDFLSNELKLRSYEKVIITSGGFKDELEVWSSRDSSDADQLSSNHEEADTRLILHAIVSNYKYIVVSSRDTDVLVLLVSHFHKTNCNELWMNAGTHKNPKYIPVHDVAKSMCGNLLKALIPFHTLTGCDTTSFIALHSKSTIWKTLKSEPMHNSLLINKLGEDTLEDSDYKNIEKFFCILYGMPLVDDINKVRLHLFLKKSNQEALPPTRDALYLHIQRAHYQSFIWKRAHLPKPIIPEATEFGWKMTDTQMLKPILMTNDGITKDELNIIFCNCKTNCNTKRCRCKKNKLSCSLYCGKNCVKGNLICCMNAPQSFSDDEVE